MFVGSLIPVDYDECARDVEGTGDAMTELHRSRPGSIVMCTCGEREMTDEEHAEARCEA